MPQLPDVEPHLSITEFLPDVYWVRGTVRMGIGMQMTRNMVIVRSGEDLTVINAVRLSPEGEAKLAELGTVKHLIKIGFYHGMDDPYYLDTFKPTYWVLPGMKLADGVTADHEMTEESILPIPGAQLLVFHQAINPECAIFLPHDQGGILLTCDSLMNLVDFDGCSLAASLLFRVYGFNKPANIGPFWLKWNNPKEGPTLKADYERLLQLPFIHLIGGHGPPIRDMAHDNVQATVTRIFGT